MSDRITLNVHQDRWSNCQKCTLCNDRKRIVLFRRIQFDQKISQQLNCHVLFIGEAPGEVENMKGQPFIGPSGQLLQAMIKNALADFIRATGWSPIIGFTNIVACEPIGTIKGNRPPVKKEVEACRERLLECINTSEAEILVCVGDTAKNMLQGFKDRKKAKQLYPAVHHIGHIIHPSAILRKSPEAQTHEVAKCTLAITNELSHLI